MASSPSGTRPTEPFFAGSGGSGGAVIMPASQRPPRRNRRSRRFQPGEDASEVVADGAEDVARALSATLRRPPSRNRARRNPIESTFATVRHRTVRSKGCLSNKTALAMVFKLVEGAQKSWRRLDGHAQLPKLILGVKFTDGLEIVAKKAARQPEIAAA